MEFKGGTHADAVPPEAWAMPPGLAIRYDRPAAALAPFVTAYNMYHADAPDRRDDWFLPSGAMLCFPVQAGPIEVQFARRCQVAPPGGFVMGLTARAFRGTTHGGALVGVGLSPGGWARLTRRRAVDLTDALLPLAAVLGDRAAPLAAALAGLPDDAGIKPLFDAALPPLLATPHPDDALIARTATVLLTDGVTEVADTVARLGISPEALRKLAVQHFGLTPKRLLRRARFLRSLLSYLDGDAAGAGGRIDSSYHDESHFLRDAVAFLGTTPRRFLQADGDFLRASVRLRQAVLGAPVQSLHDPAGTLPARAAA